MTRQGFDAAYLQRLAEGDPQTERHFAYYFGALIRIKARARRLSQALAEDVRQETLTRVLVKLREPEGVRRAEALGAFVNAVCNNVLREGYRDQKRYQQAGDDDAPPSEPEGPSPEEQLLSRERQEAVRRVLCQMSPEDGRLLREVLMAERDRDEICRERGVTRENLRVLLFRAKQEFRYIYLDGEPQTVAARAGAGPRPVLNPRPKVRPARRAVEL